MHQRSRPDAWYLAFHLCFFSFLQVHRSEGLIYMVLEYGDIDLARLLQVGGDLTGGCSTGSSAGSTRGGAKQRQQQRVHLTP